MASDTNTTIITAAIAGLVAILTGSFIAIKKTKKRSNSSTQENITIKGNTNKVVGGDDNSTIS